MDLSIVTDLVWMLVSKQAQQQLPSIKHLVLDFLLSLILLPEHLWLALSSHSIHF